MSLALETSPVCSTAFKEWAGVCHALGTGRQVLIVRKGGIAEVGGRFHPEHSQFWLYPTYVHQAEQGLKPGTDQLVPPETGFVEIRYLAEVQWIEHVIDDRQLAHFDAEHVWTTETIAKRFNYRTPGIWLLCVRIFEVGEPYLIPVLPEYLGCHTWVSLCQDLRTQPSSPVCDDATFALRSAHLQKLINMGDDFCALA